MTGCWKTLRGFLNCLDRIFVVSTDGVEPLRPATSMMGCLAVAVVPVAVVLAAMRGGDFEADGRLMLRNAGFTAIGVGTL